jgi:hypothetical protein
MKYSLVENQVDQSDIKKFVNEVSAFRQLQRLGKQRQVLFLCEEQKVGMVDVINERSRPDFLML